MVSELGEKTHFWFGIGDGSCPQQVTGSELGEKTPFWFGIGDGSCSQQVTVSELGEKTHFWFGIGDESCSRQAMVSVMLSGDVCASSSASGCLNPPVEQTAQDLATSGACAGHQSNHKRRKGSVQTGTEPF
jgi:hypothetical protein